MMKISNILFVITLTATIVGCGGSEERKAAYLEKAEKSLQIGDLDKARIELKNVLQIDPKDARAYFKLGGIFERKKEFKKAYRNYLKAVDLNPEIAEYQSKIGFFHLLLAGDVEKATELMNLALASDKDDINGLLLKAGILHKQGKDKEAMSVSKSLFEKHTGNVDNAVFLSSLYSKKSDYKNAILVLNKAVASNDDNQILLTILSNVHFANKDFVMAEKLIKGIVDAHPDVLSNHLKLVAFYQKTGDMGKAEKVMRAAVAADEDDIQRKLLLVKFISALKSKEDAIKEVETLIKNNPKESAYRLALAQLQVLINDIDGAIETYKSTVEDFSETEAGVVSRVQLARVYLQRDKDYKTASEFIEEAARISPNDSEVNYVRANIALYNGNFEQAIIALRTVVKDNPDKVDAYILLAASHRLNNEENQAQAVIARAYDNNRDNIKALLPLAKYHLQNKNLGVAEKIIDNYLRLDPDNYKAMSIKGRILNSTNKIAEGYELAQKMLEHHPEQINGYLQSVPSLISKKKIDEAIELLNVGFQKTSNIKLLKLKTRVQLSNGRMNDVIAGMNKIENKDGEMLLLLAQAYFSKGDIGNAKHNLLNSIKQDETRIKPYLALAKIYNAEKNSKQMVSILQDGVNVNPENSTMAAALALAYENNGDFESAIKVYEAVRLYNTEILLVNNNLVSLLSVHRTDSDSLNRAKELVGKLKEAKDPAVLDTVGWLYYKTADYTDAVEILKRVVEKSPERPIFNYHLGMAYYKISDNKSAKVYLSKATADGSDFVGRGEAVEVLKSL